MRRLLGGAIGGDRLAHPLGADAESLRRHVGDALPHVDDAVADRLEQLQDEAQLSRVQAGIRFEVLPDRLPVSGLPLQHLLRKGELVGVDIHSVPPVPR